MKIKESTRKYTTVSILVAFIVMWYLVIQPNVDNFWVPLIIAGLSYVLIFISGSLNGREKVYQLIRSKDPELENEIRRLGDKVIDMPDKEYEEFTKSVKRRD